MPFILIQSPDAFLQGQKTLVDFSPFHSSLDIRFPTISAPFTTSQVNEAEFPSDDFPILGWLE
jgi:hypothetical protein